MEARKRCTKCKQLKRFSEFGKDLRVKNGMQAQCKGCQLEYTNSDRGKLRTAKYKQTEKYKITEVKYHKSESFKASVARYQQSENGKTVRAQWLQSDEGKMSIIKYKQSDKRKASYRKAKSRRRALKVGVESERFTHEEVFERDNYVCQLCGYKTRPNYNQYHLLHPELDHIKPLSLNGSHTRQNTQCLCRGCNTSKRHTGTGDQLRMFG